MIFFLFDLKHFIEMLHTYFQMLLKDAKRLPGTHRSSLLLLCCSPVFSEQFDLDNNRALSRARLN